MIESKQIKKNVSLTISVQIVSFAVSLIMNLILPKFIDEEQYSYWQTFLLYGGYVPLLHLGILDGIMLRYSQYDYETLDKPLVRSQFILFLLMEFFFAAVLIFISFFIDNQIAKIILIFSGFDVVLRNVHTYTSYTFQLTNRISKYAKLILYNRLAYGLGVVLLLIAGAEYFYQICCAYFIAPIISILWGYFNNKDLYFGKIVSFKKAMCEYKENMTSGVMLLIANLSSMFMEGGAKMVIQWGYDTLLFGQIAFAFNGLNLFFTFLAAASIALFPSLKRIEPQKLPSFYNKIRIFLSVFLFVSLVLYFPCYILIKLWLPNYAESLAYLGILMPVVIFSSKVTLLTNNYLKALRKEKIMLKINVISVVVAFVLYLISAFIFNSVTLLLLCLDIAVMSRSIISEIIVMKLINKNFSKDFIIESFMVISFILCTTILSLGTGCVAYLCVCSLYLLKNKKNVSLLLGRFNNE